MIGALDGLRGLDTASVLLRLLLAMLFGGMIGLERGQKHHAAGFRTYMFVCMGSTLTGILSQYIFLMLTGPWAETAALVGRTTDVSRIGAKVIGGVGFLGAGTILITERQEVRGLTTAAGLWASACVGLAIGAGFYECAALAFVLMLLCIRLLPFAEYAVVANALHMNIYVEFNSLDQIGGILRCLKEQGAQVREVEINRGRREALQKPSAVLTVRLEHRMMHERILSALSEVRGVTTIDEI